MVTTVKDEESLAAAQQIAHSLDILPDLDPLIDRVGDARYVLLGEASHGTSDYYLWRTRLSRRLIEEKGFSFIAVEGDWPDCYRVNRYVKGYPDERGTARDVLHAFRRWPTWMWANWEVVALTEWMRSYNSTRPMIERVGFYGLDVYSLWESLEEITKYLQQVDPDAVQNAYNAYACFEPYNRDEQAYAWTTHTVPVSCEKDVINLLTEIRRKMPEYHYAEGDGEAAFATEQNALVALGAERYYRSMVQSGPGSWNIRDNHMVDTLERLMKHLPNAKGIVWEHNTHIGDARATDMAAAGMVNVGQVVRQAHKAEDVVTLGFGSFWGDVIAGLSWDAPMQQMRVPEARPASWESVFHAALGRDSLLIFNETGDLEPLFQQTRGHRAIGVVYNPEHERYGNYVPTALSRRYDAFIYLDETHALHPLHLTPETTIEPPETYPWTV